MVSIGDMGKKSKKIKIILYLCNKKLLTEIANDL